VAGTITALQQQKHDAARVNVFVDGVYAFAVSLNSAARLYKGQVLDDAEIEQLQHDDTHERAYQKALVYLGARPRSMAEVERHLREKGCADDAIAAAMQRLVEQQLLGDEDFAQFWLENRNRFRPRSAAAIRQELRQKGVDRATIDSTLEGMNEDDAAWAAAVSKLDRWRTLPKEEFEHKLTGFLARRGFDYSTVRRTVRRAWEQANEAP
jgi:regulatory protein